MTYPKYYPLPRINPKFVSKQDHFLLFETSLFNRDNFKSYIFSNPIDVIKAHRSDEIRAAFRRIDSYASKYYIAGYFAYELGYYFEEDIFRPLGYSKSPLMHLAVFDKCLEFNHRTGRISGQSKELFMRGNMKQGFKINNIHFNLNKSEYARCIAKIKKHIRNGDTYQVNFTGGYDFDFRGEPLAAYYDLKSRQNVSYSAFCKFLREYVISLSPELFFKREGRMICSLPMKGTLRRGMNLADDSKYALLLKNSVKNKAENLMVVDLIRNDLGRICLPGSVRAQRMFNIEKYSTLFQMTSQVTGKLRAESSYFDIFKTLFPGGSVTGAPKIRTMEIIENLEKRPRGIYCGALGFIAPGGKAVFNMPIRTLRLAGGKGSMGVGSGIVIDSRGSEEYAECLLKASFLTARPRDFRLIETIAWDKGYFLLSRHIDRLSSSARYFGFILPAGIKKELELYAKKFKSGRKYRVRLLLQKDGKINLEHKVIEAKCGLNRYAVLSKHQTDPTDIFLYHKTTNRDLYDQEYKKFKSKGFFDVIFRNKFQEITEGAISNVIILKDGIFFTPPLSAGLLSGVYRGYFIKRHRVIERVILEKDLLNAEKVFLCNSVRGLVEVKVVTS